MTVGSPGILLLGNHPLPYGGVPNHIKHLSEHLSGSGWRVHVLSGNSSRRGSYRVGDYWVHSPGRLHKVADLARRPGRAMRDIRSAGPRSVGDRADDAARANLVRRLIVDQGIDLLSAYHVLKPGLSAAWVAEETGLPLVTTVFGEFYERPEVHRARLDDVRLVLDRSASVLSCSRHCADSASAVLGLPHEVGVMYYGVDTGRFGAADPGAARARLNLADGELVVLYLARMVPEMGLGVLMDAVPEVLADHPGVRVVIAGASGSLTPAAVALAADSHSGGRVTVLADVPEAELPSLYAAADVVVAPSTNQRACLGLAIVEAMAAGRPVVACAVGGTAEVVVDGATGMLVEPGSAPALATGIGAYLDDAGLRERHGEAARARAVAEFDVAATNRRCETLFRDLIERNADDRNERSPAR